MRHCYIETMTVIKEKAEQFWDFKILTVLSGELLYPLTLDQGRTIHSSSVSETRILLLTSSAHLDLRHASRSGASRSRAP